MKLQFELKYFINKKSTTMVTIGDRVKALRKAKGITQTDLGQTVNLTFGAISAIEKGVSENPETLNQIADFFKVDRKWLRTGEGEAPAGVVVSPSKASLVVPESPWKDEAYNRIKMENERLWALVQKLTGAKGLDKSFLEALVVAGAKGKVVKLLPTHAQARAQRA